MRSQIPGDTLEEVDRDMNGNDKNSSGVIVFRGEIIWDGINVLSFFMGIII